MIRIRLVLFTALCFHLFRCSAQIYPDAGLWSTFSVDHKFSKNIGVEIDQEIRLKENYSRLNLIYTNFGFSFSPVTQLKFSLIYRGIQKFEDDNTFSFRNRLMFDATYKQKFGNVQISIRHRIQSEDRKVFTSATGRFIEYYSRLKAELKFDLRGRISPFVNCELRYQIHDPRNPESDNVLHRIRIGMGIEYDLNSNCALGLYYLVQHEWNIPKPEQLYITGVQFSISI